MVIGEFTYDVLQLVYSGSSHWHLPFVFICISRYYDRYLMVSKGNTSSYISCRYILFIYTTSYIDIARFDVLFDNQLVRGIGHQICLLLKYYL